MNRGKYKKPGYTFGAYKHAMSILMACKRDPVAIAEAIVDREAYRDPTIGLVDDAAYRAAVEDVRTRIIGDGEWESGRKRDTDMAKWLEDDVLWSHPRLHLAMQLVDDYAFRHPERYPNFGDKGKGVFEWLGDRIPADSEGADDVDWADIKGAEGEARPEVQAAIKRLLSYSPKTVADNG